jgi:hypothetical protein
VPGGLVAGMTVAGYKVGLDFQLLSDQASAAIVMMAEAWAQEAKDARDAAIFAAAGVDLPPVTANTMLVDNAAGAARESKGRQDVLEFLSPTAGDVS